MIGTARARVVHAVPGRMRLRFAREEAEPAAVEQLLARLREQPGVRQARFNSASGSVIVEYDPATITMAALTRELPVAPVSPAAIIVSAPRVTRSSPAARLITERWWEMNDWVARRSGGGVDLRTLAPLALVLIAIRQLLIQGELEAAPWHALLWYSYNLFFQFHPEMGRPPEPVAASAELEGRD